MFGLKNHVNNLQYSQRFYYSNYQFYNDYQSSSDFTNDISKISYNCRRKSPSIITKYHKYKSIAQESRQIRTSYEYPLTMQQFLESYIKTFEENNYSDLQNDTKQQSKNIFKLNYFPSGNFVQSKNNTNKNWFRPMAILEIIQPLLQIQKANIHKILQMNYKEEIKDQDLDYYKFLLVMSQLSYTTIYSFLKTQQGKKCMNSYYLFKLLIQLTLDSIIDTQTCSHQLLYIPNISILGYFIHPALCAIKNYIVKQENFSRPEHNSNFHYEIPKMAFINLDGFEGPLNMQYIKSTISDSLLYITVYQQINEVNQNNDQIVNLYSKFMANIVYECNHLEKAYDQQQINTNKCRSRILSFPLGSNYARSKYAKKNEQQIPHFVGSSSQILYLFESIIFQELRTFGPHIIFISYSGLLNIKEQHFNDIIRKLTILSDHKIILFPNLTNLFCPFNSLSQFTQSLNRSEEEMSEKDSPVDTGIQCQSELNDRMNIAKFLEEYINFSVEDMNLNKFFNNMAMFNKISAGCYAMQQKRQIKKNQKFQVSYKYQYLEMLAKLKQYSYLDKYCSKNVKGEMIGKLLNFERDKLLKANKQQVSYFQKFIDGAIQKIIKSSQKLVPYLYFSVKKLAQSKSCENIKKYFEQKKKSLLIETITRQKIKKVFSVPAHIKNEQQSHRNIMGLNLKIRNKKNDLQPVILDNFSQVIIDQQSKFVLCLNYLSQKFQLLWLFGFIEKNNTEVEMMICKRQEKGAEMLFQFSWYFDNLSGLLFLFWPYLWDPQEQAACLLLNLKYQPKKVHRFIVMPYLKFQKSGKQLPIYTLAPDPQHPPEALPRFGSTMYRKTDQNFYIFGGYFDNINDFQQCNTWGVSLLTVNYNKNTYILADIPKNRLQRKLKPKANYIVNRLRNEEGYLTIQGGYGRQFTNYYNIYSYTKYLFDMNLQRLTVIRTNRQVSPIIGSMSTKKVAKFETISFQTNPPTLQKQINNRTKHRFLLRSPHLTSPVSFITDSYTTKTHREQTKSHTLLQLHQNLSTVYISNKMSAQIFIEKRFERPYHISNLQLLIPVVMPRTDTNIISNKLVMVNQDAIISMCSDRIGNWLYLLVNSPIYTQNRFVIYRGSIVGKAEQGGLERTIEKRSIQFQIFYQFGTGYGDISSKRLYQWDHKLYLLGGTVNEQGNREDYVIYELRGVVRAKILLLSHMNWQILNLPNPYPILNKTSASHILIYSISRSHTENGWHMSIQTLHPQSQIQHSQRSQLLICSILNNHMHQIFPTFHEPAFAYIGKYQNVPINDLKVYCRELIEQMQDQGFIQYKNKREKVIDNEQKGDDEMMNQEIQNINKDRYRGNIYQLELKDMVSALEYVIKSQQSVIRSEAHKIRQQMYNVAQILKTTSDQKLKTFLTPHLSSILSSLLALQISHLTHKLLPHQQNPNTRSQLYKFIIEDRRHSLYKYISIGELNTNNLVFFIIKQQKDMGYILTDYTNKNQIKGKIRNGNIFGCNLSQKHVNIGKIVDNKFMKILVNRYGESIHVDDIGPFQNQIQEEIVKCQLVQDWAQGYV